MGFFDKKCHKCGDTFPRKKLYRAEKHLFCGKCINYVKDLEFRPEGERMMWSCHCGARFKDKDSYLGHNCRKHYD